MQQYNDNRQEVRSGATMEMAQTQSVQQQLQAPVRVQVPEERKQLPSESKQLP